jgi:uncharacterized YkwD family protein
LKKKILVIVLCLSFLLSYNIISAMSYYEKVDTTTGIVTAGALNVRTGPGSNYKVIGTIYKNEYVRIFAKIGSWYVIQTNSDHVGVASTTYIKKVYPNTGSSTPQTPSTPAPAPTSSASAEETELLSLINAERRKNGLSDLKFDETLLKVAREKARDMVANNYFSHNSPTYGSPFDMMKQFGVTYRTAGENIAGNSTLQGAVTAWMNSQGHRENILNSAYNYTGIGIVSSPKYGKILVQMFIGR